jgi:hypothetical protein
MLFAPRHRNSKRVNDVIAHQQGLTGSNCREQLMRRFFMWGVAAVLFWTTPAASPAYADHERGRGPPNYYEYWQNRRDPPPGHEFHRVPDHRERWDDRRRPPPNWDRNAWALRQQWLRRHGHDARDHDATVGIIAGVLLGFALGAAVVDSVERQEEAARRLHDPAWIAYCARRYYSFDPYTGTYLGRDGLRHFCR